MSSKVYCQSCGYVIKGCPAAPGCENPDWHTFDLGLYTKYNTISREGRTDEEMTQDIFKNYQESDMQLAAGRVTVKVNAEVTKAAARLGLTKSQMTSKIVREWASDQMKKQGIE